MLPLHFQIRTALISAPASLSPTHRLSCLDPRMRKPEKIIPVILAAGSSQSLQFPKALARFGTQTALEIALQNCFSLPSALVVLGAEADRIVPAIPKKTKIVLNPRWPDGQLTSLQAALRHIPRDAAFLIYPVDLALLRQRTVALLVRAFRTRTPPQEIIMPCHNGAYGHPVIVSPAVRPEFFSAMTAREVIYRFPERIRVLNLRSGSIFEDFHDPESYKACLRKFRARKTKGI